MGQTSLLQRGAAPQAMAETVAMIHTAEGFHLSLQLSLTTLSLLPKSLKPRRQHSGCGMQVPAQGQPGTHKVPSTQQLPSCKQRPKSKGHGRLLSLRPYILPAPTPFFLATSTWHAPDLLPKCTVSNADCYGAPGDEKAHSALCQASPVVLSCCNLNPVFFFFFLN